MNSWDDIATKNALQNLVKVVIEHEIASNRRALAERAVIETIKGVATLHVVVVDGSMYVVRIANSYGVKHVTVERAA